MALLDNTGLSYFLEKLKSFFLPLSGGTMTGRITSSTNVALQLDRDSGDTYVVSANRTDTGAGVRLGIGSGGTNRGVYDATLSKWIAYSDGTNACTQLGVTATSDDSATHIATTGWTKDVLSGGYLPLSGGTMSGTLVFDTDPALRMSSLDGMLVMCGGTGAGASAGAKLTLYGRDHASAGGFILQAGNSSGWKQLKGDASGSLSWGNSPVITAASLEPVEISLTDAGYMDFTTLKAWRSGNVVQVYLYFKTPATAPSAWTTIATGLPAPMMQIKTCAATWTASYARPVALSVETDGSIKAIYGKASNNYGITFSYVTAG